MYAHATETQAATKAHRAEAVTITPDDLRDLQGHFALEGHPGYYLSFNSDRTYRGKLPAFDKVGGGWSISPFSPPSLVLTILQFPAGFPVRDIQRDAQGNIESIAIAKGHSPDSDTYTLTKTRNNSGWWPW